MGWRRSLIALIFPFCFFIFFLFPFCIVKIEKYVSDFSQEVGKLELVIENKLLYTEIEIGLIACIFPFI